MLVKERPMAVDMPEFPDKKSNGRPNVRPLTAWAEWLADRSNDAKKMLRPLLDGQGWSSSEALYAVREGVKVALESPGRFSNVERAALVRFMTTYPERPGSRRGTEALSRTVKTQLTVRDTQRLELAGRQAGEEEAEYIRRVLLAQLDVDVPIEKEEE